MMSHVNAGDGEAFLTPHYPINIAQELEFMGSKPTALESKPLSPQAQNFGQEVHPDEEIPF